MSTKLSRRGFIGGVLAMAAAPAIVKADSLMRIVVPRHQMLTLWGDGFNDDAPACQAMLRGETVIFKGREFVQPHGGAVMLPAGSFRISWAPLDLKRGQLVFGAGR